MCVSIFNLFSSLNIQTKNNRKQIFLQIFVSQLGNLYF